MTDYTTCPDCGHRRHKRTPHICSDADGKPRDPEDPNEGDDEGEGEREGEGKNGDGQPDKGEGNGEGKPEQGEGEGEGEGEGGGDGEGQPKPQPQAPNPEQSPEAIICTVLKFAALTANCAENGTIEVTMAERGIRIFGDNGDDVFSEVIEWGDFEKRSTTDGEFYVKEVIDRIDRQLGGEKD